MVEVVACRSARRGTSRQPSMTHVGALGAADTDAPHRWRHDEEAQVRSTVPALQLRSGS